MIFSFLLKEEILDKYFEDLLFGWAMQPTMINTKCQTQEIENLFGWTGRRKLNNVIRLHMAKCPDEWHR